MSRLRWGILGYGRAGRARARAILEDPRCALVGAWRGQPSADGVVAYDDADALIRACDAVAVCTPNGAHARWVRRALTQGRHVVCEFPLAGSAPEAAGLLELADRVGRVLHVEHIELLSATQVALRAAIGPGPARLQRGELQFTSSTAGWLGDPALALGVAHRSVARLHRIWDLLGPVSLVGVHARSPWRLVATLEAAGGPIHIDLSHAPGAARRTRLVLLTEAGPALVLDGREVTRGGAPVPLPDPPPLFALDHDLAMARVLEGAPERPDRDQLLGVLSLADDLEFRALASP